eukprot:CAMPEP_0179441762 /NCGR_PEP_ID=MMETSP0799-20121207/25264_1 /TAXON_ID=46947 /ORGANISM="Geminigera cryophila, Strain CCMP2564" /LENGTH=212 /DNA_ID=CAMNT_0021226241 /DNA_START=8 /DNA_END=647 /DNA_ORIENTATION=+
MGAEVARAASTVRDLDKTSLGTAPSLLHMGSLLRHAPPEGGGSATLVADGRRGGPIGPPGEKSGSKLSLPQKLPGGELAAYLGTTDIPVDVMATFGGLGFLWGHARAKLGKAAMWGGALLAGGLALLSRNGYITIHWDKIQRDAMGTTTYRYTDPRKHGLLATIPPDIQEKTSRTFGKMQAALEHNRPAVIWSALSLLVGVRLGVGSAEMSG